MPASTKDEFDWISVSVFSVNSVARFDPWPQREPRRTGKTELSRRHDDGGDISKSSLGVLGGLSFTYLSCRWGSVQRRSRRFDVSGMLARRIRVIFLTRAPHGG